MDGVSALGLFLAAGAAMAAPGAGVFAVMAQASRLGWQGTLPFIGGLWIGDMVLLGAALAGWHGLAGLGDPVVRGLGFVAAAWLAYLGYRTLIAPDPSAEASPRRGGGSSHVAAGLLMTLSNPLTVAFYAALLPAFVPVEALGPAAVLLVGAIMTAALGLVMGGYAALAAGLSRALPAPGLVRGVRWASGMTLIVVAGLVVLRSLRGG